MHTAGATVAVQTVHRVRNAANECLGCLSGEFLYTHRCTGHYVLHTRYPGSISNRVTINVTNTASERSPEEPRSTPSAQKVVVTFLGVFSKTYASICSIVQDMVFGLSY